MLSPKSRGDVLGVEILTFSEKKFKITNPGYNMIKAADPQPGAKKPHRYLNMQRIIGPIKYEAKALSLQYT